MQLWIIKNATTNKIIKKAMTEQDAKDECFFNNFYAESSEDVWCYELEK